MPQIKTAIEWIRCLVSPKYAENTLLRITEKDEQKAMNALDVVIAILLIACLYHWTVVAIKSYHIYQINQYNKTHRIKSTEFKII